VSKKEGERGTLLVMEPFNNEGGACEINVGVVAGLKKAGVF